MSGGTNGNEPGPSVPRPPSVPIPPRYTDPTPIPTDPGPYPPAPRLVGAARWALFGVAALASGPGLMALGVAVAVAR